MRLSATMAAIRTAREPWLDSAATDEASPMRESARLPACLRFDVPVVVVGEHLDEGGDRRPVGQPPERFGGEEPRARRVVVEQRQQRIGGSAITHIADQPGGLRPDLGIGIVEELREQRRVLRVLTSELRDAPQAVDPRELVIAPGAQPAGAW